MRTRIISFTIHQNINISHRKICLFPFLWNMMSLEITFTMLEINEMIFKFIVPLNVKLLKCCKCFPILLSIKTAEKFCILIRKYASFHVSAHSMWNLKHNCHRRIPELFLGQYNSANLRIPTAVRERWMPWTTPFVDSLLWWKVISCTRLVTRSGPFCVRGTVKPLI